MKLLLNTLPRTPQLPDFWDHVRDGFLIGIISGGFGGGVGQVTRMSCSFDWVMVIGFLKVIDMSISAACFGAGAGILFGLLISALTSVSNHDSDHS